MTHYDVFNGDADGICALQQLRLARPRTATLVTGVKRDNALLARVDAGAGDTVTVLDVSYRRNGDDVERLLAAGARIRYIDHHDPGAVAEHPRLETHIDTAPRMSTGLIVDRLLGGAHHRWAIVSAFGDNHLRLATRLCADAGLSDDETGALRRLGIALNYNSYGLRVVDLHVAPDALYRALAPFADPLEFARQPLPGELWERYRADIASAERTEPLLDTQTVAAWQLPAEKWAQRIVGPLGNQLAQAQRQRAHAVLVANGDGSLRVSLRAPLAAPEGAGTLCARFGGGGRPKAAGIDALPDGELAGFLAAFSAAYS